MYKFNNIIYNYIVLFFDTILILTNYKMYQNILILIIWKIYFHTQPVLQPHVRG